MNNDISLSTKFKSIGENATVSMPSQIKALFGINPQIDSGSLIFLRVVLLYS